MDRIAPVPLPPAPATGGPDLPDLAPSATSTPAGPASQPQAEGRSPGGASGSTDRDAELGRVYDLDDRLAREQRPSAPPTTTRTAGPPPLAANDVSDNLASERERVRIGAPPSPAKKDPTDLPTPAEVARSHAAVEHAGFSIVGMKEVPYFNQGEAPWNKHPYPQTSPDPRTPPVRGEGRTIQSAGCAPTALAMIDCGLRNAHQSPIDVAQFAVDKRCSSSPGGAGTNVAGLAREWAKDHGLGLTAATSRDQSKNVDIIKSGIQAHGIALVSVGVDHATGKGHFTAAGHIVVINGCAMNGGQEWFAVANPGRADQAKEHEGLLKTDKNVIKVGGAQNGIGQVWISRAQLEAEMKYGFVFRPGAES
jgi:hypothetical protein